MHIHYYTNLYNLAFREKTTSCCKSCQFLLWSFELLMAERSQSSSCLFGDFIISFWTRASQEVCCGWHFKLESWCVSLAFNWMYIEYLLQIQNITFYVHMDKKNQAFYLDQLYTYCSVCMNCYLSLNCSCSSMKA